MKTQPDEYRHERLADFRELEATGIRKSDYAPPNYAPPHYAGIWRRLAVRGGHSADIYGGFVRLLEWKGWLSRETGSVLAIIGGLLLGVGIAICFADCVS